MKLKMKHLTDNPELEVKAYTLAQVLYAGRAFSVSAANKLGPLDILPGHANLLAILTDCQVEIQTADGPKTFSIRNGVLKVSSNAVLLFINV